MKIMRESIALVTIGVVDLITTLVWVNKSGASEANPIFKTYLQMGNGWFVVSKMLLLLGPVFLIEWARLSRPNFAKMGARFAIIGYIAIYSAGVTGLNQSAAAQQRIKMPISQLERLRRNQFYTQYNLVYSASHGHLPRSVTPAAFDEYYVQD